MAVEKNDWRLTGQERFLKGATLHWTQYTRYRDDWDHDHCEFCMAKFMVEDRHDVLHEGYCTKDRYRWVCQACFEDFKDMFEFRTPTGSAE